MDVLYEGLLKGFEINGRIFKLLERNRQRPNLYLGYPSLERLRFFTIGYVVCHNTIHYGNLPHQDDFKLMGEFDKFVHKQYGIDLTVSAEGIIKMVYSNEVDAFWHFFELWDKFMAKKNKGPEQKD